MILQLPCVQSTIAVLSHCNIVNVLPRSKALALADAVHATVTSQVAYSLPRVEARVQ
jgi:hypothetical protein